MKYRQGFAAYELLFGIALIFLGGAIYMITAWSNEAVYYRELTRQRTIGFTDSAVCGGPNKIACAEGQSCKFTKSSKEAFGTCI